ncbi:MAG: mercury transporter [Oscillospiraceae bacterium]
MDTINSLSICMQTLISAGLIMRIIFCAVRLTHEEEEASRYKKRIRNSAIMLVIAQLIFPLKELLVSYLGNGY